MGLILQVLAIDEDESVFRTSHRNVEKVGLLLLLPATRLYPAGHHQEAVEEKHRIGFQTLSLVDSGEHDLALHVVLVFLVGGLSTEEV